jgi:AraC family transcriptional regulator
MKPRIIQGKEKKLIGQSVMMSLVNNLTGALWSGFMPRRMEIENRVGEDFFSLQVYPPGYHANFNPSIEFRKWSLVEVLNYNKVPETMEKFTLQGGLYAVFDHKGASADPSVFQYIYGEWIPKSPYVLDDRPHFEVLGSNYKNNDPNSEEEIWIPIKKL